MISWIWTLFSIDQFNSIFLFQPNLWACTCVIHIVQWLFKKINQSNCSSFTDWKKQQFNFTRFPKSQNEKICLSGKPPRTPCIFESIFYCKHVMCILHPPWVKGLRKQWETYLHPVSCNRPLGWRWTRWLLELTLHICIIIWITIHIFLFLFTSNFSWYHIFPQILVRPSL